MKRLLSILIILCLSLLLFSCATQNSFSSTDTSTQNDALADTSIDTSTDTGTPSDTSTDTGADTGTPKTREGEVNNDMEFILKGIVKKVDTGLEIEVIESDYAFGIYLVIVPSDTPITNANGNAIALTDIKADDIVLISYSGQTMLSYPPQIVAYSVTVQ